MFFSNEHFKIINQSVLTTKAVKENSTDLIVTSPPYNVDIEYNSNNDALSYDDYLVFTEKWFNALSEMVKARWSVLSEYSFRQKQRRTTARRRGSNETRDRCWVFNTIRLSSGMKEIYQDARLGGSWMKASAPYVIAPVELILILYKEEWKKTSGSRESDMTKEEFMEWTNGLWTFPGESKKRVGHPAPFPLELPQRCIKLFSYVGDTVLDPFMGSGTTLLAALQNGRSSIGVDIDEDYCKLATKRLCKALDDSAEQLSMFEAKEQRYGKENDPSTRD